MFTTWCKPLVIIKYKKTRLEFVRKRLKEPAQFRKRICRHMKARLPYMKMMGRENYGKGEKQLMT